MANKTNIERLPELLSERSKAETYLADTKAAFKAKVRAERDKKDEKTNLSIGEIIDGLKTKIKSLDDEIRQAWTHPHQSNLDI
jgi:transcription termination factor NusB